VISAAIEAKVLALLARERDFGVSVMPFLSEELFTQPHHRSFFKLCQSFYTAYNAPPSVESIVHAVRTSTTPLDREQLKPLAEFVFEVYNSSAASDAQYIKDQVTDFVRVAAMRHFLSQAGMMIEEGKVEEITKQFEAARMAGSAVEKKVSELVSGFELRVQERLRAETILRVPTGFPNIDGILRGGIGEKELGIVMAPSNVGKSQILCNFAANAVRYGKRTLYLTLELSELEVFSRVEANLTGIPIDALSTHADKLVAMKDDFFGKYAGLFYVIEYPTSSISVETVNALIQKLQITIGKFDLILIDYADLFRMSKHIELRHELADVYGKLRGYAVENHVGIWSATQANRAAYKEDRTEDYHVSEGLGKIQIADIVLTANQTDDEHQQNKLRIFVAKNRRGKKWIEIPFQTQFEKGKLSELNADIQNELRDVNFTDVSKAASHVLTGSGNVDIPEPTKVDTAGQAKAIEEMKMLRENILGPQHG